MKEKLFFTFFTVGLFAFAVYTAQEARGISSGISGHSGIISGQTCNNCHFGGVSPEVTLNGPALLLPGASATYTLTIEGGQGQEEVLGSDAAGGINVAVTDGVLNILENSSDVQVLNGEITHTAPKPVESEQVVFSFVLTAPMTPTLDLTMYGAGNSVNNDGTNGGDAAQTDQLMVTVQEPAAQLFLPFLANGQ